MATRGAAPEKEVAGECCSTAGGKPQSGNAARGRAGVTEGDGSHRRPLQRPPAAWALRPLSREAAPRRARRAAWYAPGKKGVSVGQSKVVQRSKHIRLWCALRTRNCTDAAPVPVASLVWPHFGLRTSGTDSDSSKADGGFEWMEDGRVLCDDGIQHGRVLAGHQGLVPVAS